MFAPQRTQPSRQGLREYVLLVTALVIAAAAAVAVFGDELRALFGVEPRRSAAARAPAPGRPPP